MLVETLSAELERLFELPDLTRLSREALGFDPEREGGLRTRASFARALAEQAVAGEAVEALLDSIAFERRGLPGSLQAVREKWGENAVLAPGQTLGKYAITGQPWCGPLAHVYPAEHDGRAYRLKVLHARVAAQRSEVNRFLTAARLGSQVLHASLPSELHAGALDAAGHTLGIAHSALGGETLAASIERRGGRPLNEVLPLIWAIAEALAALHTARLVHGSLHAENVLVVDPTPNTPKVLLLDLGSHFLRRMPSVSENSASDSALSACSPEQFRGKAPSARSDVYAIGVLIYQLSSGKTPFVGAHPVDALVGHLTRTAEPLSFVAAGSGVTPAVDAFVRRLLEKAPEKRARHAAEVLEGLRRIWRTSARPPAVVTEERLAEMFDALALNPNDEKAAAALESSVDFGADPARLADGFYDLTHDLRGRPGPVFEGALQKHLSRAARLYEAATRPEHAERAYSDWLALDPSDASAAQGLLRAKKALGKYEELIESLLEQSESSAEPSDRALRMASIGELYESELDDKDQALFAYSQACFGDPLNDAHAAAVERLAGDRLLAWEGVLERASEALADERGPSERHALLFRVGLWYAEKLMRPDLALPRLSELLISEPNHDRALSALAPIYKKAHQWAEYGQILLRRADIAAPNAARDFRADAADVLVLRLGNAQAARELYASVLEEDPGHARACEGQAALLTAAADAAGALAVRLKRARTSRGEARSQLLSEVAEGYEHDLDQLDPAEQLYREVLAESPHFVAALRGLDRVLTRTGRYRELLDVLRTQAAIAVTAQQKVNLYQRIAVIYDEEYLDHERAADALELVLDLDPEHQVASHELSRHLRALERYSDLAELYRQRVNGGNLERRVEAGLLLGRILAENLQQPGQAISAYDRVLELSPGHPRALDALATLRAVMGDAEKALAAIAELGAKAKTPSARAELEVRAAQVLEARGDTAGALRRYKLAADLCPDDPVAHQRLLEKYVALGNYTAAVELLEREIQNEKSEAERARLAGKLCQIYQQHLQDSPRAIATAQLALHIDPENTDALRVLGILAYAEERYAEAAKRLEPVLSQLDHGSEAEARELAFAYVDALARSGSSDKALVQGANLMIWLSDDPSALLEIAEIAAEQGSAEQALRLCDRLLDNLRSLLSPTEEAQAEYLRGEALRKLGRTPEARAAFTLASERDPNAARPLRGLARLAEAEGEPRQMMDALYRELSISDGDRKVEVLLEIGDVANNQLSDSDYAAKSYLLALSERPNDRTILTKLMQLYGAEKDWPKLVQVITALSRVVEEPKHKAKYLHTASMIASRELSDLKLASKLLDDALRHDPDLSSAIDEALTVRERLHDYEGVKNALRLRVANAERTGDKERQVRSLSALGEVYHRFLERREQAVAAYESASNIDPDNTRFQEKLAKLYADEPLSYFDKAVDTLGKWVEREPYKATPYKLLRKVYTEARQADAAWCACQALHVLGQAEPDEQRFFERMRSDEPAEINEPAAPDEWLLATLPESSEPFLTELFALIQPFVVAARARPLSSFGLSSDHQIDVERYPYGVVIAVHHAARALSLPEPRLYQNPEIPSCVSFLTTAPPALLLGARAFSEDVSPVVAAFLAGRHLAYYLPGLYVRQLLGNMIALKSWLFAAVRLVKPKFPVTSDLEAQVDEASRVLSELATGARLEQLTEVVAKLLRDGAALDLKRWVQEVDRAADTLGFVLSNDLETAITRVRALPQDPGAPALTSRIEQLIAYSVSARYMHVREHLGILLDGG